MLCLPHVWCVSLNFMLISQHCFYLEVLGFFTHPDTGLVNLDFLLFIQFFKEKAQE